MHGVTIGAPLRVLVVDDSFIMRKLVCEIVETDDMFTVVGQAENGKIALRLVRDLKPDIVLLDIEMPEMSGLETLRRLGLRSPCKVIILSSLVGAADSVERLEALRLGAAATIGKPSGAVSLDLNQKRASEIVSTMRRISGLPLEIDEIAKSDAIAQEPTGQVADLIPVLDCTSGGVMVFDGDGRLSHGNVSAQRILALDLRPGMRLHDIFSDFNEAIAEDIWQVVTTRHPIEAAEVDFAVESGDWIALRLSARILESQGAPKLVVAFDDMSKERRLHDLLAKTQSRSVARLLTETDQNELGGSLKRVSILFSDIRGFTTLSETLGAEDTVAMLNEYFSFMADVIRDSGGMIDKFIGDAIMALFGAPSSGGDDADRAVAGARAMISALDLFNQRRTRLSGGTINIGIGIGTGPVVAGTIGSTDRMNYTVIGDAANLASRLEALTKPYATQILACQQTIAELKVPVPMRRVDRIRVKGQDRPTDVFEIFVDQDPARSTWMPAFDEAFEAYLAGSFTEAIGSFDQVLKLNPEDQMSTILRLRCKTFPSASVWDGVWTATDK